MKPPRPLRRNQPPASPKAAVSGPKTGGSSSKTVTPPKRFAATDTKDVSVKLQQRLQAKRRNRAWTWFWLVIILLLVLSLCASAVWILYFSNYTRLELSHVSVSGGQEVISTDQVLAAVKPYQGVPVMKVDTQEIADALAKHRWVKSAWVGRRLPHGLKVQLTLRQPVALVEHQGGVSPTDSEGVMLPDASVDTSDLPHVQVHVSGVTADPVTLGAATGVFADLPAHLQSQVKVIVADTDKTVEITLDSGVKVMWGANQDNDLKDQVLEVLLDKGGTYFDVSDPVHPTVR